MSFSLSLALRVGLLLSLPFCQIIPPCSGPLPLESCWSDFRGKRKSNNRNLPCDPFQADTSGDHEEDGQAAYNPADGRIYFNRHIEDGWLRPSRYDIYSCRMDSSDLVRHTTLGWHFSRISTRPFSGGSLYFVGDSPEVSRTPDAAVMKLSLKFPYSVTQVFPSFADPWEISASLDGSRLALITSVRGGYECWSIEAKTGSSTMVGKLGYGSEWPLFAPDRSSVLFMMHKDARVTLNQITAKGQESVLFQIVPEPVANDPKQTRVGQ